MADNKPDPLIESLMALAVSAAPLIKRARDSGMFKAGSREDAAAEAVVDVPASPPPEPATAAATDAAADFAAQKAALQDIIVSQAIKIASLEAELARASAGAKKAKSRGAAT